MVVVFFHGPSATPSVVLGPATVFENFVPEGVVTIQVTVVPAGIGETGWVRVTVAVWVESTHPETTAVGVPMVGHMHPIRVMIAVAIWSVQLGHFSFTVAPVEVVETPYVCDVTGEVVVAVVPSMKFHSNVHPAAKAPVTCAE